MVWNTMVLVTYCLEALKHELVFEEYFVIMSEVNEGGSRVP